MKKSKIFSFFAGSGFLDLGFETAGFDIAFVNENCPPFLQAYKHSRRKLKLPKPQFGFSSLNIEDFLEKELQAKRLKSYVKAAKEDGSLIGFIGGPPCPDFSMAGKHKGFEGENGRLTQVYFDLILKQKPDWFLFENVKGLFYTKKHREFSDSLFREAKKAGYAISYAIVNALEFGVPQYRDRVIVFGVKKEHAKHDVTLKPANAEHYVSYSELLSFNLRKHADYSLKNILKHKWPETDKFFKDQSTKKPDRIPKKLTVGYWLEKNNVEEHPNAEHYFLPTKGNKKFQKIKEGCASKKSFKRLHRWRYSPTAAYGNNEVHLHPFKERRLSAAEALAIQSMPAGFELPANMTLSYMFKTIGNGVPFLMAQGVARSISDYLKYVGRIKKKSPARLRA